MSDLVKSLRFIENVSGQHKEYESAVAREAADRIEALEAEVERLNVYIQAMVEKAADESLDGYRELGDKLAVRDAHIDTLSADLAAMTAARDVLSKAADDALAHLKESTQGHERMMVLVGSLRTHQDLLTADLAAARAERDGLAKALRKGRDFLASASADQWNDATGLLHEFEDMTSVALAAHAKRAALPTTPEQEDER